MKMKKVYMSPAVDVVECVPAAMVATSPFLQVDNSEDQHNEDDFVGEAAGTARDSWGNIWNEM